jgi:subtilisin-like proprotein convertase family protein
MDRYRDDKEGTMMFARTRLTAIAALTLLVAVVCGPAGARDGRISPRLARTLGEVGTSAVDGDGTVAIWVRFTDKGLTAAELAPALAAAESRLGADVAARRQKGTLDGGLVDQADLPLAVRYLAAVVETGATIRRQSRWLNAASFDATPQQIQAIAALPGVAEVDVVARGRGQKPALSPEAPAELLARLNDSADKSLGELDYGHSLPGLAQINVPAAHALGLSGEGVTVAMLDTGFELDHECLQNVDVVDAWDFVNDDSNVGQSRLDHPDQTLYGTAALSVLVGYSRSNLIGAAYNASVILAKTEDLNSETPIEEDNWIAALEWAEGLGADVVSSGLGYYSWYDFSDLDGYTALITVAAELAAARGVCVVNAGGDQGGNPEWPHILPPADGRSVIAVGAVNAADQVASSSSPGPTADGRIKPDVMALGVGHPVAYDLVNDLYFYGVGSNYAVPLVSGVVALMLEQNRSLSPLQIMEALRLTADRSELPNNNYGWGICDAMGALGYWAPAIVHTPLADTEGTTPTYPVTATITDRQGLDVERLYVAWRVAGQAWSLVPMTADGGDQYTGRIPRQDRTGQEIEYYISASGTAGRSSSHPGGAPQAVHRFREGADTTPPVVSHLELPDLVKDLWPPTLMVRATDNLALDRVDVLYSVPGQGTQGPTPLVAMGDDTYALEFPVAAETVFPGFTITYLFIARDAAQTTNQTTIGPFAFDVVLSKGKVLLVDDRNNTKQAAVSNRPGAQLPEDAAKSAPLLDTWLTEAGFEVDIIAAAAVKSSSFLGYDAVMVSSGSNFGPYSYEALRRTMAAWTASGGKLIIEGGETAYAASESPGYPELNGPVLPITGYSGEDGATLRPSAELADHPLLNRPHRLPSPLLIDNNGGFDYGAADQALRASNAFVAMHVGFGSPRGGVIVYDNNTGPDAGQIVYLPFNITKASEADGRALLDNAMTYLLTTEPPGTASISGRVTLAGQTDFAGITVRSGMAYETVTAADGTYTLAGLWGGDYTLTVEKEGHAPATRSVTAVDDQDTGGTDFYLVPVTEANYVSNPGIPIPDNDEIGVSDTIDVTASGTVYGITVDADLSHFAIGHLIVTLTDPGGTEVVLHNRSGGTADDLVGNWPGSLFVDGPGTLGDFLGESAQGTWTLHVADRQFGALGTLNSWGLNLLVTTGDASPVDDRLPAATRLIGNAPNPFNPRTTIAFDLARPGPVRLEIFDVKGRLVRRLVDRSFAAGRHSLVWDGRDESQSEAASGVYFARLLATDHKTTDKMLLVR